MVNEVLDPGVVGIPGWRDAVLPAFVFSERFAAPVAVVEWRIGKDIISLEVRVQILVEAVGMFLPEIVLDLTDGKVHLGETPGGVVGFLTKDADISLGLAAVAVA